MCRVVQGGRVWNPWLLTGGLIAKKAKERAVDGHNLYSRASGLRCRCAARSSSSGVAIDCIASCAARPLCHAWRSWTNAEDAGQLLTQLGLVGSARLTLFFKASLLCITARRYPRRAARGHQNQRATKNQSTLAAPPTHPRAGYPIFRRETACASLLCRCCQYWCNGLIDLTIFFLLPSKPLRSEGYVRTGSSPRAPVVDHTRSTALTDAQNRKDPSQPLPIHPLWTAHGQ